MTAMQTYEKLNEAYGSPRWWADAPYDDSVVKLMTLPVY